MSFRLVNTFQFLRASVLGKKKKKGYFALIYAIKLKKRKALKDVYKCLLIWFLLLAIILHEHIIKTENYEHVIKMESNTWKSHGLLFFANKRLVSTQAVWTILDMFKQLLAQFSPAM